MSALSLRRSKDPTSGTKLTAVKPTITSKPIKSTTPVSKSLMGSTGKDSIKRSSGKENPRPISRIGGFEGSVKAVFRNVPRIEKGSGGFDNRLRWSTSSVPRGRSESPCEISRGFGGLSKDRVLGSGKSKVVENGKEKKGFFGDSGARNGRRSEIKGSLVRSVVGLEKSSDLGKDLEVELKGSESSMIRGLGNGGGNRAREESRGRSSVRMRSSEGIEKGVKEVGRASLSRSSSLNALNGKCRSGGGGTLSASKYPSKLHEKLAFLEGKVKKITSDIKKTREILDSNNPDVSKVIITDIQEKISGIEKVMCHVVDTTESKIGVVDRACENKEQIKVAKMSQNDVDQVRISVKGLNTEEMEAKLFPHQKLLRDRTVLKSSVEVLLGGSQTGELNVVEFVGAAKMEDKLFIPIDENPIAVEFLASLKDEQSKDTNKGDNQNLKFGAVQEMDGAGNSAAHESSNMVTGGGSELVLTTSETLDEFDDQENVPTMVIGEESEENCIYQLNDIGHKTATGGWFVSDGESVLLAHDDSSCTFYDVAHCEEKAEYRPPIGVSPNVWRDCWVIRAPSADGCSGKYVVAASAGNTMDSGFCSWDFYTKEVRAVHIEDGAINTRTALAPLPNNTLYRRNTLSSIMAPENQQWWYKPSGPLIISTACHQRVVKVYDIRDGEHIMKWEVQKPVQAMDYSSPLQWRNRGKVVIAEAENISLWDVNSLNPQSLVSVSLFGRKVSALHVNNTDAEMGGGVRERVSSSEAEGNDGVFCTSDSINILDFRHPTGVGLKIPKLGTSAQSVFSHGDFIYIGCTNLKTSMKKQSCSQVLQFSLRKQRLVSTYTLPESNAHSHYTTITQVWGNSNLVMGACGLGLFAFDAFDDQMQSCSSDYGIMQKVRDVIGPDDMYSPSFDYMGSRVLLISRDRPAMWRYLL